MRSMSYDQYGQSGQQNSPQGWGGEGEQQNPWSNPQEQGSAQQQYADPGNNYPGSQPSASYPGSQPSASFPGSQPSASFPGSQPSAAYGHDQAQQYGGQQGQQGGGQQGQQGGQQGQQGGWAAQPPANDPGSAWASNSAVAQPTGPVPAGQGKGLFGTLFDFTFAEYATPALAKILYILGIVMGILGWLGGPAQILLLGNVASAINPYGSSDSGAGTVVLALLGLIIGLIPLAFWIIGLRMGLEFILATVRTQQDTAALRAKQES